MPTSRYAAQYQRTCTIQKQTNKNMTFAHTSSSTQNLSEQKAPSKQAPRKSLVVIGGNFNSMSNLLLDESESSSSLAATTFKKGSKASSSDLLTLDKKEAMGSQNFFKQSSSSPSLVNKIDRLANESKTGSLIGLASNRFNSIAN